MDEVLDIGNLSVTFKTDEGIVRAVRGVSLTVQKGEMVALVGESGCGKSTLAQTVLRLHPVSARVEAERLLVAGHDVMHASAKSLSCVRGVLAGMIFQDPMSCLNPTMKVGRQVTETLRRRKGMSTAACRQEAVRLLKTVHIPDPEVCVDQYPHQLSGGMRQRVMIAMALSCDPELVVADEPTTALDATTQAEVLRQLRDLCRNAGTGLLLVTHDLGVVANMADRAAVMYAGALVEEARVEDLFAHPCHPYTQGLLASLPGAECARGEDLKTIPGAPPSLCAVFSGCPFAPRCEHCMQICLEEEPPAFSPSPGHRTSCWLLHPDALRGDNS